MKTQNPSKSRKQDPGPLRPAESDSLAVAEDLARKKPSSQANTFALLERDLRPKVFQLLDVAHQENILSQLGEEEAADLLEEMDPDDRVRLLEALPDNEVDKLLTGLSEKERRLTTRLLSFPVESAGRIMSPEFLTLDPGMTVERALSRVRAEGRGVETLHTLPVTDGEGRLVGMVELKNLVLAEPGESVAEVMSPEVRRVRTDEDQETVARLLQAADLLAIPVVDAEDRLLGLVTVDDAMDVLSREEEEDIARAGGAEPLRRPYFSVSDFRLARSRIVWLMVLSLAATLTVHVLNSFEQTLDQVVTLALFIPLLIGTGGNAGAQSSTTVVRSMAVGDVHPGDFFRTVLRETRVGFLLGGMLGLLSFLPVWIFADHPLALVISLTLLVICTLASAVGAVMPLLAQVLGVDPAVASAPFVTTLVDASGLLVYFLIARAILQI